MNHSIINTYYFTEMREIMPHLLILKHTHYKSTLVVFLCLISLSSITKYNYFNLMLFILLYLII